MTTHDQCSGYATGKNFAALGNQLSFMTKTRRISFDEPVELSLQLVDILRRNDGE
jgi:hypothetical protein